MVDNESVILSGCGFMFEIKIGHKKDVWADCVALLTIETSSNKISMNSESFFMSSNDFKQLINYLRNHPNIGDNNQFSYVPSELGFDLRIIDADEAEATVQILLLVGTSEGNRVYAGGHSQVHVSAIYSFVECVTALEKSIFQ